jgi:Asp-tRNA(Asn)/Glu-tRNA(Gln) amidotransferase A subunit family amidase
VHSLIYDKALAYYFKEEFKRKELISPILYDIINHGNQIILGEYLEALKNQSEMAAAMDCVLEDFDAFISIGTGSAAPLLAELEVPDPSLVWTLTYLPTVSIPLFKSPEGLPFSLQIGARRYNDYRLLDLLDMLEENGSIPQQSPIAEYKN